MVILKNGFIFGFNLKKKYVDFSIEVLSSGLVAMEAYIEWILMGKTNLLSEKEDTAMMVISMFV